MNKHYIIYHNKDLDGFCSAYIASKSIPDREIVWLGRDCHDPFDLNIIIPGSDVTITDISLEPSDMIWLRDNTNLLWFDHHASAIDKSVDHGYDDIKGVRRIGDSASLIIYEYYNHKFVHIDIVEMIDRYDVFKNSDDDDWNEVLEYQYGFRLLLKDPCISENLKYWDETYDLLILSDAQAKGSAIIEYINEENKKIAKNVHQSLMHPDLVECNFHRADIDILNYVDIPHKGAIVFSTCKPDGIVFSFRKRKDSNVNILEMAKSIGGGGHECACGGFVKY